MTVLMNSTSDLFEIENGEPNSLNESHKANVSEQTESVKANVAEQTESVTRPVEVLSAASTHHAGSRFQDKFQGKQGSYADLSSAKMSDFMKINSLESASTLSLFTGANKILDDSFERKNINIPQRVVSALKLILQEIEQRISRQGDDLKKQKILFKSREDRYQSKIRTLETLATGATQENEVIMKQLQQLKIENKKGEEKRKLCEQNVIKLMKEKDQHDLKISALKEELDLEKAAHKKHCLQLETQAEETEVKLEKKLVELECFLSESRKKVQELESFSESKSLRWNRREHGYKQFVDFQFGSLQGLRVTSESIKQEVLKTQKIYSHELNHFGSKLNRLLDAAQDYHTILAENRKLYNEVQDLKGNIRVHCRIRPFLPGQSAKQTAVEYIGENGELVVANPSKQGKDGHRLFTFNRVFGTAATQEEVFRDTQPLIRSVLDGYNVCIFAYGQTGSGKTYTMTGPSVISEQDWGVNYRALSDLFHISQSRKSSILYEVGVQMVEIYNEQVRDLLNSGMSHRRLGIWNTAQPNGLAVPDASMHPVKSTADVLELMNIGLINRVIGATAMNERSSRSHSVLIVHVRGTDLETNAVLRGSLHLVDLAGSERVDRSEATGDRLREAQHINKSLSALGDVIFALAQKSSHVPYRNSKLTQVLQSSLGGQAKTLMFVQLNPDVESYSETISTLKFAERVSGVELGASRSNREGRSIRELMEQVAVLKDTIAKKDDEIGRLLLAKTNMNGEKCGLNSPKYRPSSPRRYSVGTPHHNRTLSRGKSLGHVEKVASYLDNSSECSYKHFKSGCRQSLDDLTQHKETFRKPKLAVVNGCQNLTENVDPRLPVIDGIQNFNEDVDLLGFGDDSEERLCDISDSGLSMGTETDGSMNSIVEYTLFPETVKSPPPVDTVKINDSSKLPTEKKVKLGPSRFSLITGSNLPSSSKKLVTRRSSSQSKPLSLSEIRAHRRWQ